MKWIKKLLPALLAGSTMTLTAANWNDPALTPVSISADKSVPQITLFENGKSSCVIVIPDRNCDKSFPWLSHIPKFNAKAPEYQQGIAYFAAWELRKILQKAGAEDVKIVRSKDFSADGRIPFFVGASSAAKKYGFDNSNIPAGGFKVEFKNNALAVLNAPYPAKPASEWDGAYALVYGVYDFAERFMECRFYYPGDGTIIPASKKLTLPGKLVYTDAPYFNYRNMYSFHATDMPDLPRMDPMLMALRYRAGGHGELAVKPPQDSSWPDPVGKWKMAQAVDAAGKKIRTRPAMPCFSDPRTLEAWLKAKPSEGKYLLIMPPDHPIKCQCRGCAPLYDRKSPYHGTASPVYIDFVRRASEKALELHPEKMVYFVTYYNYTSPPPDMKKLPPNTQAKVCLMYGQNSYEDPAIKNYTDSWIKQWHDITGRKVLAYVYPNWPGCGYSPFPKQYYRGLKKFFAANRQYIAGLFSDGPNVGGVQAIQGNFYAFSLPSTYCEFKLLWNPDLDVEAAVEDMCMRMYGKGGKSMYKILTAISDLWESKDISKYKNVYDLGDYQAGGIPRDQFYRDIIKPEFVKMLKSELEKAYNAVEKDSAEYRRIDFFGKTFKLFFMDYERFCNPPSSGQREIEVPLMPYVRDIAQKATLKEWENVPSYQFVNAYLDHSTVPPVATSVQIAYDKRGLLCKFNVQEPEMAKVLHKAPDNIWSGDCLEIFTEYAPDLIFQLTVNSTEAMRNNFVSKRPAKRYDMPYRYFEKYDKHWIFLLYLPFTTLDATVKFSPDRQVFFNAARTRMLKDGSKHVSRFNTSFIKEHKNRSAFVLLKFKQ